MYPNAAYADHRWLSSLPPRILVRAPVLSTQRRLIALAQELMERGNAPAPFVKAVVALVSLAIAVCTKSEAPAPWVLCIRAALLLAFSNLAAPFDVTPDVLDRLRADLSGVVGICTYHTTTVRRPSPGLQC